MNSISSFNTILSVGTQCTVIRNCNNTEIEITFIAPKRSLILNLFVTGNIKINYIIKLACVLYLMTFQ